MDTGVTVPKDGHYPLMRGEKVIPASGRQSEYRDCFLARGAAGLHKYNAAKPAVEQTRQVGGNTHPTGEKQPTGGEKVANPIKD